MKNQYQYIDVDCIYTDSKTSVLKNKENIQDYKLLMSFEGFKVSQRLEDLKLNPIKIKDANSLLDIHKYLFQDIYTWAGQKRTLV